MLKYNLLRQYNHVVNGIRFLQPTTSGQEPYLITYFSENSTFLEDYKNLNIKNIDVKIIMVPRTLIPRTRLTPELIKQFKSKSLYPITSDANPSKNKNLIYDLSYYLQKIDDEYNPKNYRQRIGKLIISSLSNSFLEFPNYKKVLMYSINIDKKFNDLINRKIFPLLDLIKENNFYFDDLILVLVSNSGVKYRLLIKNKQFTFDKIYRYLKTIKSSYEDDLKIEEDRIEDATNKIHNNIVNDINPKNNEIVKGAIHDFLLKDKKTMKRVLDDPITQKDIHHVASAAILYKVNGNISKSKSIVNKIVKRNVPTKDMFQYVDKNFSDQILEKPEILQTSENILLKVSDIINAVDNKVPSHLFQKRQIDFKINLKEDIFNSFNVLENKELPLKISEINISDKLEKRNELDKSDISLINVVLEGKNNQKHHIRIEIPKIDPNSGTFRVNGKRKCLINQITLCPITFPKKYDSKFESSYSQFHIHSKRTRNKKYLDIYIAAIKNMSLLIVMSYCFGFDETMKKFNIDYEITKIKPKKDEFFCKINDSDFLLFKNINDELKEEMVSSLMKEKIENYNIKENFGSKKYFNDLIISITGRINSTYMISSSLENIVDPVSKQVLINKQLPIKLDDIMYYMSAKVVTGYSEKRNDLANQRIRGSEVIVHLLQKQILAAYTVYKQQILAGNQEAKFEINQTKLLSQFINSEIVTDMEYANPVEEMATMTRISPVGKSIGGIPDKQAIQLEGRNVHPSYFGNIDPLDTPEGENIGVTQQLAVDALITSKRGLFANKEISDKEGSGILSTSSCMIPFVENNDGARIMMAANQARQMLPLKNPTPPIVKSGYESILTNVLSNNFIKRAPFDARVLDANNENITLLSKDGIQEIIDLTPVHLKSGTGKDTLSVFKLKVKIGQSVKLGHVLAEGSCIEHGEISLGRTLLVGLMPYKGYNFEDGVVINEKLIENDKLTSLHGIIEEVFISSKDRVTFLCKLGEYIKKGDPLIKKSIGEIEELLGYDEEDESSEIAGQLYIKKSPGGRVVDIDIYCNTEIEKFPLLKEFIIRTRKRYGISEKDKFVIRGKSIDGILIKFKIEQELKIGLGDKLCNRYGNKGIISLIEKDENMPRTPWGETLDIILNPIGVIGRMNLGQLYELYCGLIAKAMAKRILNAKSKEEVLKLYKNVLPLLDGSPDKKFSTKMISNLSKLSNNEFNLLIQNIKETGFSPIIIPPFKAPKSSQINQALKIIGLKSGYQLYLPEFNVKTTNEVPVGYMYISKLEHIGEMKIHSRSTGPTTSKYMQPTSGKSREGGQRLGEADTYAIISYNCPALLAEFLGPLSDDVATKNEIISEILQNGSADYRIPKISPVRDLLASYFISLMLQQTK